jgi:hypothetical protein
MNVGPQISDTSMLVFEDQGSGAVGDEESRVLRPDVRERLPSLAENDVGIGLLNQAIQEFRAIEEASRPFGKILVFGGLAGKRQIDREPLLFERTVELLSAHSPSGGGITELGKKFRGYEKNLRKRH